MSSEKTDKEMPKPPLTTAAAMISDDGTIDFHYLKSQFLRNIHVDGVFGGLSPKGNNICMVVFSERWPIPTQTTANIAEDGKLGSEIAERRITRRGAVRELEANLIIDIPMAKIMMNWLKEKIDEAEAVNTLKGGQLPE